MNSEYILTPSGTFVSTDELYHHGILGMKWGVRRYQNEDGTLTDAGKKRYGTSDTKNMSTDELRRKVNRLQNEQDYANLVKRKRTGNAAKSVQTVAKVANSANTVYKATGGDNNPYAKVVGQGTNIVSTSTKLAQKQIDKQQTKEAIKRAEKETSSLTDAELARKVEHLRLEQRYDELQSSKINKGKTNVGEVLDTIGDIAGIAASAAMIMVAIKKIREP